MGELGLLGATINGYGCAGVGNVAAGVGSCFLSFFVRGWVELGLVLIDVVNYQRSREVCCWGFEEVM